MAARQKNQQREGEAPQPSQAGLLAKRRAVLHHPWRVRVLEVLSERTMSCVQFVDEGLIPELSELPRDKAISDLAYHFRVLREAGAIEVVEENRRRGSTEMVCRGQMPAYHTDEEWAKLSVEQRRPITDMTLASLIARAHAAVTFDTFDHRVDRHLSYTPMDLDEQGWAELVQLSSDMLGAVIQVKHDAKKRLAESGEQPIRVTHGQLAFESPPLGAADDLRGSRGSPPG